jgi:hypothetical protein
MNVKLQDNGSFMPQNGILVSFSSGSHESSLASEVPILVKYPSGNKLIAVS